MNRKKPTKAMNRGALMSKQFCSILTPLGALTLQGTESALTGCFFDTESTPSAPPPSALLAEAAQQLKEYFTAGRREFTIPVSLQGTPFQLSVWDLLHKIPYGETRTYGELAAALNNPGAARAVGMACHLNPAAIIIPCHRVIGSNDTLVGFAAGVERKRKLLKLEGVFPEELF